MAAAYLTRQSPPPKPKEASKKRAHPVTATVDAAVFDATKEQLRKFVALLMAPLRDGWPEGWVL